MPTIVERETRRGLVLPVHLSGRDPRGTPFAEEGRTLNVSGRGLCFEAGRRLPVGSRVDLRIPLPAALRSRFGGRSTYAVRAVVCRLEAIEDGAGYRIGARLLGEIEA